MTRGERLNNPGNIRHNPSVIWQGQALDQPDPAFVKFIDPQHGFRAMAEILNNYKNRDGVLTYAGAISRYSPPSENDTADYITDVCKACGVQPGDDFVVGFPLLRAITDHEQGVPNIFTDDMINQGIALL